MRMITTDFARSIYAITMASLMLLISACSSTAQQSPPGAPGGLSGEEFHAKMAEFERMQPSLQRLAALEPELKELISQLAQIAQAAESQEAQTDAPVELAAQTAVQKDTRVDNTNINDDTSQSLASEPELSQQEPPPEPQEQPLTETQRGPYSLQLTAVTDKSKLRASWLDLQQQFQPILTDLTAISQQVEVSGVTFYRIKAGFYESLEEAKKNCDALKQAQASCIVSDNRGEDIL